MPEYEGIIFEYTMTENVPELLKDPNSHHFLSQNSSKSQQKREKEKDRQTSIGLFHSLQMPTWEPM